MVPELFLGLMLAFEQAEGEIMRRPPRDPKVSFITSGIVLRMMIVSALLLAGAFALFNYQLYQGSFTLLERAEVFAVGFFICIAVGSEKFVRKRPMERKA